MKDVKKIIVYLKERAIKSFRRNSADFEPKLYFLLLFPGQKTPKYFPIPCSRFFENEESKSGLPTYSALCWEKKKLECPEGTQLIAVCLISDSWGSLYDTTTYTKKEIDEISSKMPPCEDPVAREAIAISICTVESSSIHMAYYKRKGKKIVFEETLEGGNFEGIMSELYPKGDNSALLDTVLNFYQSQQNFNHN